MRVVLVIVFSAGELVPEKKLVISLTVITSGVVMLWCDCTPFSF